MADGGAEFHVELDDPAGNSYLQVRFFLRGFCVTRQFFRVVGYLGKKVAFLGGAMGGQGGRGLTLISYLVACDSLISGPCLSTVLLYLLRPTPRPPTYRRDDFLLTKTCHPEK